MDRMVTVATLALVALLAAAPLAASPELTVTPEVVSIVVPAGGRVAVVGVMQRVHGVVPGFERWEGIVEDDDGDGRVEIALERSANPEWSQWIAVDLDTGELATAGRSEAAEPARPVRAGEELAAGSSLWPVAEGLVEVLVVRPGEGEGAGAWSGEVWDGGSADGDGAADGVAGVAPGRLRPVGASGPAPETYQTGDVLIAITPRALRHGVTRVVEGTEEMSP
jgi:hypothetical protein